ncbi:MAG: methyltransferase domain-containing protein [Pseudonocardiales bacterium]|nr:methyltransferase domain-containing protein [Pseudonocardiales bacterium]MBV9030880.1 methyltransferase domain-containing protein [Pseudonocardiales bacterium]
MGEVDLNALKVQTRETWARGDYRKVSGLLMPAAEALVQALDVGPGQTVLDVAAGTGNVALAAARRGAAVTAADLTLRMLELGRARAEVEGIEVSWVEADAEDLPFADGSFDFVTSAFGVMFAPRPEAVVTEAARVLRPGGLLGMVNPTWDGYNIKMSTVRWRWSPQPPDRPDPYSWGDETTVRTRLAGPFESIECRPGAIPWVFDSPAAHRSLLETFSPSHVAAREAIGEQAAEAMFNDLEELSAEHSGPDGTVQMESTYLLVLARRG